MPANYIKFNDEQIHDIIDRYVNQKQSLDDIAYLYSVSVWKIQKELTKNGVKMRGRYDVNVGRVRANKIRKIPREPKVGCYKCNGEKRLFVLLMNIDKLCYECGTYANTRFRGIKCKYNIKKDEYIGMLREQNFSCKICKVDFYSVNKKDFIHVDHCHKNGHVRGILCNDCNTGIGFLKEEERIFLAAIEYIKIGQLSLTNN